MWVLLEFIHNCIMWLFFTGFSKSAKKIPTYQVNTCSKVEIEAVNKCNECFTECTQSW